MYLKDPKTGEKSVTLTLFVVGFIVALAKLAVSGLTFKEFSAASFSGSDFAAVVGALGGVYWLRRRDDNGNNGPNG